MTPPEFANKCLEYGITIERCAGSVLTLTKTFTPGSNEGYAEAESACSLIYSAPGKGGSVWGTDGGSIGGMEAMRTGLMRMNKTGVPKRFLKELSKLSWARSAELT